MFIELWPFTTCEKNIISVPKSVQNDSFTKVACLSQKSDDLTLHIQKLCIFLPYELLLRFAILVFLSINLVILA